ncbi:MAG: glycosyltransferase family 2 protein [Firmicutes bacterium]|nr:glycosyltransferase family 2 protein [Bacillota bacterium]
MIDGWAISLENKKLTYSVIDKDGNEVASTYRSTERRDLIRQGLIQETQTLCGFHLSYTGSAKILLKVSDGKNEEIIDLKEQGIDYKYLIKSYVKSLNAKRVLKGIRYLVKYGPNEFIEKFKQGPRIDDRIYHYWFLSHRIQDEELEKQKQVQFSYAPTISIVVPTFNTPRDFLEEMIGSVIEQSYPNWQLCIADGSENNDVLDYVESLQESRIVTKKLEKNYGISGNTNEALKLATGEYVGLYDHDDILEPDCLFEIVSSLQEVKHDCIYTDEDKFDNEKKEYCDPNLKPDFSIDLLCSHNYITHFFVVKKTLLDEVGYFRSEFDGAQDYDLILRCTEKANSIHHIAKSLYHWRMHSMSTAENPESKMYCYEAGKKAIEEHLKRIGVKGNVEMLPRPFFGLYHTRYETVGDPLVSIVIPNKDEKETLKTCVESLMHKNTYKNIEVIIIENNSTTKEIFDYYKELESTYPNVKVVYYEGHFNYSRINNFGEKYTKGDYLLFLNNDTEVKYPDAISEMLGCCMRKEVGIVGARLLYDDDTIQHAGVVIGFGGYAGHVFHKNKLNNYGFMFRAILNCNYSAVTAACLMVKRSIFEEVEGFDESFEVACNDIDFCLKVREKGYFVTYNPVATWYHYESKTRGYENDLSKSARFDSEIKNFQRKWKPLIEAGDPFYNKNFNLNDAPFKL